MKLQKLLLPEESQLLRELESTIERGKNSFIEVGLALAKVRDGQLYRTNYKTFEEYCQNKWGWTKQHAYRLIECAPIAQSNTCVTNARQAHALSKVPEESRIEVIKEAKKRGKVTAKAITDIAAESQPTEEEPPRVKTYDAEFLKAIGIKHIPSPLETEIIESLEIGIANFRLLIDDIKEGSVDCAELGDVKLHSIVISKQLNKLQQELKCK